MVSKVPSLKDTCVCLVVKVNNNFADVHMRVSYVEM